MNISLSTRQIVSRPLIAAPVESNFESFIIIISYIFIINVVLRGPAVRQKWRHITGQQYSPWIRFPSITLARSIFDNKPGVDRPLPDKLLQSLSPRRRLRRCELHTTWPQQSSIPKQGGDVNPDHGDYLSHRDNAQRAFTNGGEAFAPYRG